MSPLTWVAIAVASAAYGYVSGWLISTVERLVRRHRS